MRACSASFLLLGTTQLTRTIADMPLHAVRNRARRLRLVFHAPLVFERLQCFALHARVSIGQHQKRRGADARANQAEILGCVEQARIPALPRGQEALDLLAQTTSVVVLRWRFHS